MRYFNEEDIKLYDKEIFLENYSFEKKASSGTTGVFLSHSSKDKSSLPAVINFLEKYGMDVYIDKDDRELPRKTSSKTGEILKKRIHESNKFIVFVSRNSKDSRWVPWELGIADEKKQLRNIAILPSIITGSNTDWPEQEYLGLYPRIAKSTLRDSDKGVWMVYDHHNNTGIELGEWLNRS